MPAPLLVAVAAAQRTRRIRFGTGVILVRFHHPLRIAEEAAVADILTGRRLIGGGRFLEEILVFNIIPQASAFAWKIWTPLVIGV